MSYQQTANRVIGRIQDEQSKRDQEKIEPQVNSCVGLLSTLCNEQGEWSLINWELDLTANVQNMKISSISMI